MTSALRIGLGLWVAVATVASADPPDEPPAASGSPTVKLLFTYGSEKKKWIEAVTQAFNAGGHRLPSGELIKVEAVAVGSGELVDEIIAGRRKPQLVSPASGVFLDRGNAKCREQGQEELFEVQTRELVSSPLVVAMWREKAEAIGWPGRRVRCAMCSITARSEPLEPNRASRMGQVSLRTHPPVVLEQRLARVVRRGVRGSGEVRRRLAYRHRDPWSGLPPISSIGRKLDRPLWRIDRFLRDEDV